MSNLMYLGLVYLVLTVASAFAPPAGRRWLGVSATLLAVAATCVAAGVDTEPKRARTYWFEEIALNFNDKDWRSFFRVPKAVFNYVLDKILSHDVFRASSKTHPIDVGKQLAIFLYRIGSSRPGINKIAVKFEVAAGSIVNITARVARAINERLGFVVHFPKSGSGKERIMQGFAKRGYRGGVAIIDGTGVPVVPPTAVTRAGQRQVYMGKDAKLTQRYQVACDMNCRILSVWGGNPGSVHDMDVFTDSPLFAEIKALLRSDEFYLGDAGYTLRPYMMSPYKKAEIEKEPSVRRDARTFFNRHYSAVRITVERCIGRERGAGGTARERCRLTTPSTPPPHSIRVEGALSVISLRHVVPRRENVLNNVFGGLHPAQRVPKLSRFLEQEASSRDDEGPQGAEEAVPARHAHRVAPPQGWRLARGRARAPQGGDGAGDGVKGGVITTFNRRSARGGA